MTDRDRDEEGNFESRVSDDELLEFVASTPNCTATKVAEEFGYETRQGAGYRLRQLEASGEVRAIEEIGSAKVWDVVKD